MSSSVYMKVLESAPHRYDRGIMMLTRGRIKGVYLRMAQAVAAPGKRILDIGCGTGNVSLACAKLGATVLGIDISAEMLEVAREKTKAMGLEDRVEFLELGVAELEGGVDSRFDAAVACLTFSELTPDERSFTLTLVHERLAPGGTVVIADEVLPRGTVGRFVHRLSRIPTAASAYLITQTTTHPLEDIQGLIRKAGFVDVESTSVWPGFEIVCGKKGV